MVDQISESIEIAAPLEDVWRTVMDPRRLGEWVTTHRGVDELPEGELGAGSSFRQRLALAGREFEVRWTVTECEPPRWAAWEGRGPAGSVAGVTYGLSERDGVTLFDYANGFELPGGPLGRIAGKVVARAGAQAQARKSLQRLRALIEGERRPGSAASG